MLHYPARGNILDQELLILYDKKLAETFFTLPLFRHAGSATVCT